MVGFRFEVIVVPFRSNMRLIDSCTLRYSDRATPPKTAEVRGGDGGGEGRELQSLCPGHPQPESCGSLLCKAFLEGDDHQPQGVYIAMIRIWDDTGYLNNPKRFSHEDCQYGIWDEE